MTQALHGTSSLPPSFAQWTTSRQAEIEAALSAFVAPGAPQDLAQTMRYAVLDGGKRLRPLLVLASHEAVLALSALDAAEQALWRDVAVRAACAVELIHAYSLVHDDMPCMDNDMLRRGKPTTHVQFGQASALLAGDAMQALAFELLTPESTAVPAHTQAKLVGLLARAAGGTGMAGGQAIDLAHVGKKSMDQALLETMHALKTGALLNASVEMGFYCTPSALGDARAEQLLAALKRYGALMGLAFQVVDDVLDATADSATLGKTAGKDAANDKPTFVSLMGVDAAQAYAEQLHSQAIDALKGAGLPCTEVLEQLAAKLVQRQH